MIVFSIMRTILIGISFLGFISPLLFYPWIHGDYDRYLWIIHQGYPCNSMGSGSWQLWYLVILPWIISILILGSVIIFSKENTKELFWGLIIGGGFIISFWLLMFYKPNLFIMIIGC